MITCLLQRMRFGNGPKPKRRDVHVWSAIGKSQHDSDIAEGPNLTRFDQLPASHVALAKAPS